MCCKKPQDHSPKRYQKTYHSRKGKGPYHVAPKADLEELDRLTLERAEILFVHGLISVGGDLVGAMFSSNGFERCTI